MGTQVLKTLLEAALQQLLVEYKPSDCKVCSDYSAHTNAHAGFPT